MYFATLFLVSAFVCEIFAQNDTHLSLPPIKLADKPQVQQIDYNYLMNYFADLARNYNMLYDRLSDSAKKNANEVLKQELRKPFLKDDNGNPLYLTITTYDDFNIWLNAEQEAAVAAINYLTNALSDSQVTYTRDDRLLIAQKRNDYIVILIRTKILQLVTTFKQSGGIESFAGIIQDLLNQLGSGDESDPPADRR